MAEYLEKSKMKQYVKNFFTGLKVDGDKFDEEDCCETICQIIDFAPAADVVEVKHGKWEENRYAFCNVCSECGTIVDRSAIKWQSGELNFCLNCGAKMDGEHNEK